MWLFSACTFRPVLVVAYLPSVSPRRAAPRCGTGRTAPARSGPGLRGERDPCGPLFPRPAGARIAMQSCKVGGCAGAPGPGRCTSDPGRTRTLRQPGAGCWGAPATSRGIPSYSVYLLYRMGVCRRVVACWVFPGFCFVF